MLDSITGGVFLNFLWSIIFRKLGGIAARCNTDAPYYDLESKRTSYTNVETSRNGHNISRRFFFHIENH